MNSQSYGNASGSCKVTIFKLIVDETLKSGTIDFDEDENGEKIIVVHSTDEWFQFMKEYNNE